MLQVFRYFQCRNRTKILSNNSKSTCNILNTKKWKAMTTDNNDVPITVANIEFAK